VNVPGPCHFLVRGARVSLWRFLGSSCLPGPLSALNEGVGSWDVGPASRRGRKATWAWEIDGGGEESGVTTPTSCHTLHILH